MDSPANSWRSQLTFSSGGGLVAICHPDTAGAGSNTIIQSLQQAIINNQQCQMESAVSFLLGIVSNLHHKNSDTNLLFDDHIIDALLLDELLHDD